VWAPQVNGAEAAAKQVVAETKADEKNARKASLEGVCCPSAALFRNMHRAKEQRS